MRSDDEIIKAGEAGVTKFGEKYLSISDSYKQKVLIEFQDEHRHRRYVRETNFKNGVIMNPYRKQIYGIGYIGDGHYQAKVGGKITPPYRAWSCMLRRCYDEKFQESNPAYVGCTVDIIWHNYQNFAKWWEDNYYSVSGERMDFDKDILVKGNTTYMPDRCCIVPHRINLLLVSRKIDRGDTPIGVQKHKCGAYSASCGIERNVVEYLGVFKTAEGAFEAYKARKEKNIADVANRYRAYLPIRVYDALIKWRVEITD